MAVKLLDPSKVSELRASQLTYDEVVRPVASPPPGYAHFSRTHELAASMDFAAVSRALMTWQVQARSGLQVFASSTEVALDAVIIMRLGVGAVGLSIPCRVVDVIDEPDRQGFSYGSLPGHPESGEESFSPAARLERNHIHNFGVFPAGSRLARLGGPFTSAVQRFMTGRYLHALD